MQTKVEELQHLAELSRKTREEGEEEQLTAHNLEKERLVKQIQNLKLELANTIAMNVESDEANRESAKRCEKLSFELDAIQKLYRNATAEIVSLKSKNECLQRDLDQARALADEFRETTNIIQAQVINISILKYFLICLV